MPHAQQKSDEDRAALANLVAPWIDTPRPLVTFALRSPELMEGFEIWVLDRGAISAEGRLNRLATQTQEWHHQIRDSGSAHLSVRATASDGGEWALNAVLSQPITGLIEDGAAWIDQNIQTDETVRLLRIPSRMREVFWLESDAGDRVVPIDPRDRAGANFEVLDAPAYLAKIAAETQFAMPEVDKSPVMPLED